MSSPRDGSTSFPASLGNSVSTEGTIYLSPVAVSLSAAVLLVNAFISLRFKLGLHTQLVIASIRMVVQLSLLGYILVPIFTYDKWWLVLLYGVFMLLIASLEAVQRPSYTFQGVLANTLLAMATSSGLLLSYMVLVVLGLRPVWEAQYIIPLLGMLLGNATSAVSVGLSTVLEDLASNRAVIEHLLALGANRFEATDEAVRRALKVSMTPLLNQMSVMGVVSIPGMMTGQILAGGNPTQAARYQMVIIFIVVAATGLASVSSIYLAVLHVVDSTHTFCAERLIKKQQQRAGAGVKWADWVTAARRGAAVARRKGAALGRCLGAACCCCFCPPPAPRRRTRTHSIGGGPVDGPAAALLPATGSDSATSTSGETALAPSGRASAFTSSPRRQSHWRPTAWIWRTDRAFFASPTRRGAAANPDYPRSADSGASSLLLGAAAAAEGLAEGPGSCFMSPLSGRVAGAAGSSITAKPFWDERMLDQGIEGSGRGDGGVYDAEEGCDGAATGLGPGAADQAHQALVGPGPAAAAAPQARGGWSGASLTRGSSMLSSSVSTVLAVGGWLGSQASAGWGAAWDTVAKWRSPAGNLGATGPAPGAASGQRAGTSAQDGYEPLLARTEGGTDG
ncbi:hypothetical protein Vafri_8411 [Volvox africanus]|nr:hypothetical protein Vafri_8411 [Volvox africanus]